MFPAVARIRGLHPSATLGEALQAALHFIERRADAVQALGRVLAGERSGGNAGERRSKKSKSSEFHG
jgi:hypothetical protein